MENLGCNVLRCELAPETLPTKVENPGDLKAYKLVLDRKTDIFTSFGKALKNAQRRPRPRQRLPARPLAVH